MTILLVAAAVAAYLFYRYKSRQAAAQELADYAQQVAREEDLANDFLYTCPGACVLVDRTREYALFVQRDGQDLVWESMPFKQLHEFGQYSDKNQLLLRREHFDGVTEYTFTGRAAALYDLHRRFNAIGMSTYLRA